MNQHGSQSYRQNSVVEMKWIQSEDIGSLVMEELAELDEITYVRFASVYRSFKDVSELESLLQQITQSSKKKKER